MSGGSVVLLGGAGASRPMWTGRFGRDRRILTLDGQPFPFAGVSGFPLCRLFTDGHDIDPFLDCFPLFNVVRTWDYVPWIGTGWESCTVDQWLAYLEHLRVRGWGCALTLLTGDEPERVQPALNLLNGLAQSDPINLLIEIANEPRANGKHIDVEAFHAACEASGFIWASGLNETTEPFIGTSGTDHSPRDSEWQRKGGHNLYEFYTGQGPDEEHPPWEVSWREDEPKRPDQCLAEGKDPAAIRLDYRAYFGSCRLLGSGATFHFEHGKYGQLPDAFEQACADESGEGLAAFPADIANASPGYRRIDEHGASLRTYTCGTGMVRIPPLITTAAPEPGWTMIDDAGILWRRT